MRFLNDTRHGGTTCPPDRGLSTFRGWIGAGWLGSGGGRGREKSAALAAYLVAVAQARLPVFYDRLGVPDTLDGRFEMICLHVFLILHRLRDEPKGAGFAQALFDFLFADMDQSLREMGTGDLSVGREVKRMATAFNGRIAAYEAGLAQSAAGGGYGALDEASQPVAGDLEEALRRNLFGTVAAPDVAAMTRYTIAANRMLDAMPVTQILSGRPGFPAPEPL